LGIKNKYENIDNKISEIKNESINKYAKNKDKSQNREV
jgi:hypothetical protein